VKRRRFNAKKMQRAAAQLRKWCNAKNQLALRITGQFFDLMLPGHLSPGPKDGGFVFESPRSAIVSAIAPIIFATVELRKENGRLIVTMNREEGRITIAEIDTPADMLAAIAPSSKLVH
jgi:hypothetical protein